MFYRGARRNRSLLLLLVAALATSLLVVAAPPAGAAYECAKSLTSPEGDAPNAATGGDEENLDNLDVIAAGINADDGTTLKVAVGVKNLDKTIPSNATSVNWYFHWSYGDVNYFGRASVNLSAPDTVNYTFGTFSAPAYTSLGATEGTFTEGPAGTVEIHIPLEDAGAPPPGDSITQIYAVTSVGQGVPGGPTTLTQVDRGPKGAETYGTDYVLGTCGGGGGDGGGTALASPKAGLGFNDTTPKKGSTITATAKLKVCGDHAGTTIELQKKAGGKFKKVASKKLSSTCVAKFKVVASFKSATFRSYWPQQDEDHRAGQSKPVTVTTH